MSRTKPCGGIDEPEKLPESQEGNQSSCGVGGAFQEMTVSYPSESQANQVKQNKQT